MFSSSLQDEVRAVQEDIDLVAERIDNASVCQKIERYVNAPFEIQTMYRRDAGKLLVFGPCSTAPNILTIVFIFSRRRARPLGGRPSIAGTSILGAESNAACHASQ
jgi:hypothetical protein